MKYNILLLMGLALLLVSCSSAPSVYRPNTSNAEVIGTIQTVFSSTSSLESNVNDDINQQAYIELKKAASEKYQGNIDVVNITISIKKLKPIQEFTQGFKMGWNYGKSQGSDDSAQDVDYSAAGQVIFLGESSDIPTETVNTGIEEALVKAIDEVNETIPPNSRIAIVYITSLEEDVTQYIFGEAEHLLRLKGHIMIDRIELDRVREEQLLALSGEVDDNTAARIGHIAGAELIIVGGVDGGSSSLRRLRLRALDTTSAEVKGTGSQRY